MLHTSLLPASFSDSVLNSQHNCVRAAIVFSRRIPENAASSRCCCERCCVAMASSVHTCLQAKSLHPATEQSAAQVNSQLRSSSYGALPMRAQQQAFPQLQAFPSALKTFQARQGHKTSKVLALRRNACRTIKGIVELAHNLTGITRVNSLGAALPWCGAFNRRGSQIVVHARSGRSALYGDAETYVLMEPGEEEQFVTAEELQEKLKNWLQEWPGETLPIDLTKFENVDEAVQFLVNAVCELELGDGQGSLQWYEVRLD